MPISLSLQLRDDLDSSEVNVSGFELRPLDDEVAHRFGIPRQITSGHYNEKRHGKLWGDINNWWGRFPNEFITGDPVNGSKAHKVPEIWTPYKDSNRNPMLVERKAVGCKLIETTGSTDAVSTTNVRNWGDDPQEGQEAELAYTEEVTDERYSENSVGASLTNSIEVTVGGEFAGFKAEAKRTIEFTVEWNHTSGKRKAVTKGRTVRLKAQVNAKPHSIYPVSIMLGKGTLKVRIDYEYRLTGDAHALYFKPLNGSLFSPPMPAIELLESLDLPTIIKDSEILDVGFVTHGDISIGSPSPLA